MGVSFVTAGGESSHIDRPRACGISPATSQQTIPDDCRVRRYGNSRADREENTSDITK
ncbi:hypothetical protein MMCCUG48898_2243 [Mycobacteroides abscessus subsp. massiliense CCUG 48898 = JCM 15300]|nr:hypothetical protein MMCCUG48898_2243 [Mycobacteroides abscessus subsp. massiliense CCUG 48898 = JCM 15300]